MNNDTFTNGEATYQQQESIENSQELEDIEHSTQTLPNIEGSGITITNTNRSNNGASHQTLYKRILSQDQKITTSRQSSRDISLIRSVSCSSPPPYHEVSIQAPPKYKYLLPNLFRTFSHPINQVTVPLSSSPDNSNERNGKITCGKIASVIFISFLCVIVLVGVYILSKKWGLFSGELEPSCGIF